MKQTQRTQNPFEYSDSNKRYYTYDYYLRRTFGGKCAKIPLDIGLSCPNIDGRCSVGGCIYCSGRGSGDFAEACTLSVGEQYRIVREKLSSKWSTQRCIPYFQAHTNTYAPLSVLKKHFEEALALEGAVGLNIATRADCLEDDVVEYLAELAGRTVLTVELGLQTVHDSTAKHINRGHTFEDFVDGFCKLRAASPKINICVHLIFGLPHETDEMMLESVKRVAELHPEQVKIHLLHVIRGTEMARMYLNGEYVPLEKEHYVGLVADAIELLPPDVVVARLTGDGMADDLLAPEWSKRKVSVINDIDKLLYERNSYQGKRI
ncbi:MAG: TIGR01212 family radical SAM protein [Ruminococcaceae bacterium]|nr:TIGR01212 family radical SAM protein [Oscillospiraceae bacterium]